MKQQIIAVFMFLGIIVMLFSTPGGWSGWSGSGTPSSLAPNATIGDGTGTATVQDNLLAKQNLYLTAGKLIQVDITGSGAYRSLYYYSAGSKTSYFYTIENGKILFSESGGAYHVMSWHDDGSIVVNPQAVGDKPTANGIGTISFYKKTTDPTMQAGYAGIYSKDVTGTGEMFTIDEAGNVTQISSHDPKTGKWIFIRRMLRLVKF